jgi:hypothetical protein
VGELEKYNAAKRALAEAHRVDEAKDIRDKAMAMRLYAMQARDRVLIDQATEIRLRAERRAGELLAEMAERGQRQKPGEADGSGRRPSTPTLSDLGVSKSQSSRWQKLAELEAGEFEDVVTRARQAASAALDRAQPNSRSKPKPKPKPKRDAADMVATCVYEVEAVVRAAVAKLDPEERLGLFEQLERTLRTMRTEASDNPERWRES